jgi:hypothetical protein
MSSLLYGTLTRTREAEPSGTTMSQRPPGVNTYVDALAALVPAEVLAVHALVISWATKTEGATTTIVAPQQLAFWFWFLIVLAPVLYVAGLRAIPRGWNVIRMLIPGGAFLGWTMLQPTTAFDAVGGDLSSDWRWTAGLALAVVLGLLAGVLGVVADRKAPN